MMPGKTVIRAAFSAGVACVRKDPEAAAFSRLAAGEYRLAETSGARIPAYLVKSDCPRPNSVHVGWSAS